MMVQACHLLVDFLDNYIKTKRADSFESALFLYYLYRYYLLKIFVSPKISGGTPKPSFILS